MASHYPTWRCVVMGANHRHVQSISDVQPLLVPHGIVLTATADINTPLGVQVPQHVPMALVKSLPLLQFVQYTDEHT